MDEQASSLPLAPPRRATLRDCCPCLCWGHRLGPVVVPSRSPGVRRNYFVWVDRLGRRHIRYVPLTS